MYYKFQDILKIVIPGLYLAFAISVVIYMTDSDGQYVPTDLLNMLKTPFANAIAVFLPFGGYIIGYLLNVVASGLERLAYEKEWLKRPSLHVLQKWDTEFYVKDSECIFKTLGFTNTFSSENTRLAFRKAKMSIKWNDVIENFYLQSIIARNILMAHIIVIIACAVVLIIDASCAMGVTMIILALIAWCLFLNWRRRSFLYVERVFAEVTNDKNKNVAEDK